MLHIYLKNKKKSNFTNSICAAVANERLERIEILSGEKTESVNASSWYICVPKKRLN